MVNNQNSNIFSKWEHIHHLYVEVYTSKYTEALLLENLQEKKLPKFTVKMLF